VLLAAAMRPQESRLRVLLVAPDAPQADTALALGAALAEAGVDVVGRTASESLALGLYFERHPDVVVLDSSVAPQEPARLVGLLKRVAPGSYIVVAVPAADSMPARAARALGADAVSLVADLPDLLAGLADAKAA